MMKISFFNLLFVFGLLLTSESFAAQVAGGSVNLRSTTATSNDRNVMASLPRGTQLEVLGAQGNFFRVKVKSGPHSGKIGFIYRSYVTDPNAGGGGGSTGGGGTAATGGSSANGTTLAAPVCGCSNCRISSSFGMRRHPIKKTRLLHAGCDVAAPRGTVVRAAADGVVAEAGTNGGYGKMVDLSHSSLRGVGNNATTRYAHLLSISVSKGQSVRKGQEIGKVDSTGSSTGHHLHFEVRRNNTPLNPQELVNMNPKASCSSSSGNSSSVAQ